MPGSGKMTYVYRCRICSDEVSGDSENGVVIAAERHYVNQHGLQHGTDVEPSGIEFDEEAIREDIEQE